MNENTLFKGKMPQPKLGVSDSPDECWWSCKRPQTQPGQVPQSGFRPVYQAGKINPQTPAESTPNFALRKKAE